jgi:hypothetical protein
VHQNDNMAMGAREAVEQSFEAAGKAVPADLRVLGCDGSVAFGARLVIQGKLSATIVVPPVSGPAINAGTTKPEICGGEPVRAITMLNGLGRGALPRLQDAAFGKRSR